MPQGLQIFDASANIVLDVSSNLTRYIGYVDTNKINGSISNSLFLNSRPWYQKVRLSSEWGPDYLTVSFNGDIMTWTYNNPSIVYNIRIFYGVY